MLYLKEMTAALEAHGLCMAMSASVFVISIAASAVSGR